MEVSWVSEVISKSKHFDAMIQEENSILIEISYCLKGIYEYLTNRVFEEIETYAK